jgi:arylamine N-acetyltransferase
MTEAAGVVYTEAQLRRYLERINFPSSKSLPELTLENLRRLVAAHLEACPFENLSLHYSAHPKVDLDAEFIFDKFVNRHRGGYCMEQNRVFSIVLRSLGYDVYTVGGRVLQGLEWGKVSGWDHMAIILTLSGIEYLVDVGFGSGCLTAPLPIFNGSIIEEPASGVIPEEHRVHRAEIPGAGKKGHKIWMLQLRYDSNVEWQTQYIFEKDFEFFAPDYEVYFHIIKRGDS